MYPEKIAHSLQKPENGDPSSWPREHPPAPSSRYTVVKMTKPVSTEASAATSVIRRDVAACRRSKAGFRVCVPGRKETLGNSFPKTFPIARSLWWASPVTKSSCARFWKTKPVTSRYHLENSRIRAAIPVTNRGSEIQRMDRCAQRFGVACAPGGPERPLVEKGHLPPRKIPRVP